MDRTRQIVVAATVAGLIVAAIYVAWPKAERSQFTVPHAATTAKR